MPTAEATLSYPAVLESFQEELRLLSDLYRAIRRQRRYMLHRQVDAMREQIAHIDSLMPRVRTATRRREVLLLTAGLMPQPTGSALKEWVESADDPWRGRLDGALTALAKVGSRLRQINFQNFQLARFSLDLTQEEIHILAGEAETGVGYSVEGDPTKAPGRGVVNGRA
jgi:flagellar biosynthesis/type III secretory pathway chaperone